MKVIRIWFVALILAAGLRDKPMVRVVYTYYCEYIYTPQHDSREDIPVVDAPKFVPIPEMEWRSFIDQKTGLWTQDPSDTSITSQ